MRDYFNRLFGRWRSMESAPKDGTRVLLVILADDGVEEVVGIGHWARVYGWVDDSRGAEELGIPLRWKPLPRP